MIYVFFISYIGNIFVFVLFFLQIYRFYLMFFFCQCNFHFCHGSEVPTQISSLVCFYICLFPIVARKSFVGGYVKNITVVL